MQHVDGGYIWSPSDLVNHLACEHLTQLNRLAARGELVRPADERSEVKLIQELGDEHELRYLEALRSQGLTVVEIADAATSSQLPARHSETVAAMQSGVDVIFQATFFNGQWRGHADFLLRASGPSPSGDVHHYEPYDTKLARTAKVSALVQLADYAHHLTAIQGRRPERVHIVLGDNDVASFKTSDIDGFHRRARERLIEAVTQPLATYPEPVAHCSVCRWHERCSAQRDDDDHLVQVFGVGRTQIKTLRSAGIASASELAAAEQGAKPARMQAATWDRIRAQAKLQKTSTNGDHYELLDPSSHPTGGFKLLPEPSDGDLFFDIEGDPYRGHASAGLEYLWGVSDNSDHFRSWWAHDAPAEQEAFEGCVDFFMDALSSDPTMHVYHYAPYEVTALKRLASRFGSRIEQVDHLLRNRVLVDLYSVTRNGLRVSTPGLSIKDLEAFYGDERLTDVQSGMESVVQYEAWLGASPHHSERDQSVLDDIEAYNRDDCISTRGLRDWLEARRAEAVADGATIARPVPGADPLNEDRIRQDEYRAELRSRLTADHDATDPLSHARWILGSLLDFHSRETKPGWWRHFDQVEMSPAELWDDSEAVAGLTEIGAVGTIKNSNLTELAFDAEQPHKLKPGERAMLDWMPNDKGTRRAINIHSIDAAAGTLVVKQGKTNAAPMPQHLISTKPAPIGVLEAAVTEVGETWRMGRTMRPFPRFATCSCGRPHAPAPGLSSASPVRLPWMQFVVWLRISMVPAWRCRARREQARPSPAVTWFAGS